MAASVIISLNEQIKDAELACQEMEIGFKHDAFCLEGDGAVSRCVRVQRLVSPSLDRSS